MSTRIIRDPHIQGGSPVIAGTRWTTDIVTGGWESVDDIQDAYPHITRAQIDAAIRYEFGLVRRAERQAWRIRRRVAAWVIGVPPAALNEFVPMSICYDVERPREARR